MKQLEPNAVIKHPIATEKALRLMQSENKLVFVVEKHATKADIKKSVEELFKARVTEVNTHVTSQGIKQAYVSLSKATPAIDIATNLGLM